MGASLLLPVSASAHDVLVSSNPTADSVLVKPPGEVTLVFDQDVQPEYAEMAVTIGSQAPVEFSPTVDGRDVTANLTAEHLTIPPAGSALVPWKVGFRIVSADGHPVTGLLGFSVGSASAAAVSGVQTSTVSAAGGRNSQARWIVVVGGVVVVLLLVAVWLVLRRRRVITQR